MAITKKLGFDGYLLGRRGREIYCAQFSYHLKNYRQQKKY